MNTLTAGSAKRETPRRQKYYLIQYFKLDSKNLDLYFTMTLRVKGFLLPPFIVHEKFCDEVVFIIPVSYDTVFFFKFAKFRIPFDSRANKLATIRFNEHKSDNWNKAGWYNNIERNVKNIICYNAVRLIISQSSIGQIENDQTLKGDTLNFTQIHPSIKLLLVKNINSLNHKWSREYYFFNNEGELLKLGASYYFEKFDKLWNFSFDAKEKTDLETQTKELINFFNPSHISSRLDISPNIYIEDLYPKNNFKGYSRREQDDLFRSAFENDPTATWGTNFF